MTDRKKISYDYSTANFIAIVFSTLLLITYIFLPWVGTKVADNAAGLFANNLYDTPGVYVTPFLWLILIELAGGLFSAMFGLFKPNKAN